MGYMCKQQWSISFAIGKKHVSKSQTQSSNTLDTYHQWIKKKPGHLPLGNWAVKNYQGHFGFFARNFSSPSQ